MTPTAPCLFLAFLILLAAFCLAMYIVTGRDVIAQHPGPVPTTRIACPRSYRCAGTQ
jgi:hypothetical protein